MHVLAVGVATLDIINMVASYPHEDAEVRALRHTMRRGGNATNLLVVLSQLGHDCHWAGTIAEEPDSRLIFEDLARYHIDISSVRQYGVGKIPTSYVILSDSTGSRTIVHFRDLPEYRAEDFKAIDTHIYDWIHFEGREVLELQQMLQHLRQNDPQRPISLEVEKPREGIERLYPYANVLLFSRAFALAHGYDHPSDLFTAVRTVNHEALLCCAWGVQGAWMQTTAGELLHEAQAVKKVVDTLAAGDVFNAGVIHGLLRNLPARRILKFAVRLAADKCAQDGLDGLAATI